MALAPTANNISVREVLEKFEAEFSSVAKAVQDGEFALWVGSGISRQAPSIGDLIEKAFEYIRVRAVDPAMEAEYLPALEELLTLSEVAPAGAQLRVSDLLCMSNSVHASKPKEHEDNDDYEGSFRRAAERR